MLNVALSKPSASAMPDLSAVSVWPTWAVPLMVGAPVGGLFCLVVPSSSSPGPATTKFTSADSILPSPVQMAPWAAQSCVTGSTTVTSPSPSGVTVISQRTLLGGSSRSTFPTSPPVTVKEWLRSVT